MRKGPTSTASKPTSRINSAANCAGRCSQSCSLFQFFRITFAFHFNLCQCIVNAVQFVLSQFNVCCTAIFFQAAQFCSTGNGHYPGLLCQQPCQCYLGGCGFFLFRHLFQ